MDKFFIYLTNLSGDIAYFLIFGILVACGLGFPLPEDVPLIASGYLIWDGTMNWAPTIVITMVGVLLGDTILFYVGGKLGLAVLSGNRFFKPEKVHRAQAYFRKYGEKIVFFARFVAGFRAAVFFLAGAMKMPYLRFIILDTSAAILSVPVWIGIGYGFGHFLGEEISKILVGMKHLRTGFSVFVFAIILLVAIRLFFKYRKAKGTNGNPG